MNFSRFIFPLLLLASPVIAADATPVIPLWEKGAPGFEDRRNEPEQAASYWVKNIHNPSITVFLPPKEKATGAAVVICPGGGHRELGFVPEGIDAGKYFNSIGVTAFALKYRLAREPGSPYNVNVHARQDGQRAMRLVRSRAKEWGVDPTRIGMVGFSAGGEVASLSAFSGTEGDATATDPIDQASARPDFLVFVYPGGAGIPQTLPTNAPRAFLVVANDDGATGSVIRLLQAYRTARVPVEAHIFAHGQHAFNMGNRSKLATIKGWPQRMADWMFDNNILDPAFPAPGIR